MKLIMQPTPETCGQACIAMIAEKTIEEVIKEGKDLILADNGL